MSPSPIPWCVLFSLRSFYRANTSASTAVQASLCVDYVLAVLFGDCFNRTFGSACAASDAVVIDLISHSTLHAGCPAKCDIVFADIPRRGKFSRFA